MAQITKQVKLVPQAEVKSSQLMEPTALFDADGNPIDLAAVLADFEARLGVLEA